MTQAQQYEKIGAMFHAARESTHVDLDRVARELFIRVRYLKALESGRFHELPGPAYVKGYLLAYANYLHMDEQEILRQFQAIEADFRRTIYLPAVLNRDKNVRPWMVGLGLVVALVACFIGLYPVYTPPKQVQAIDAWRQQLLKKGHISEFSARNDACFQAREQLYPACYAQELKVDLLPLKRRSSSVMDVMWYFRPNGS